MIRWPQNQIKSKWGRLMLTPSVPEDDVDAAALRSDPETRRYLTFSPKSISPEQWRAVREERALKNDQWTFHIHFTPPGPSRSPSFAGQCGLSRVDMINRSAEMGIIVHSRLHRTGIATEALYMTLSYAFECPDLKLHRVQFMTSSENVQMRGWLESLGIEMEFRMREAWTDGQDGWVDVVVYSILEMEWPPMKRRMEDWMLARLGPPAT